MNPFMTPGAFSSPHIFAANQYAAAVAAAAAAAQSAAPATISMHQSNANHDTTRKSPFSTNCHSDGVFVSKSSGNSTTMKKQLSNSSGGSSGIIKASPTHYNHRPPTSAPNAAVVAAASIGSPSGPATDPLTAAAYYMNPATMAIHQQFVPPSVPASGCDSTSDQQQRQANAVVAAQAHYQAVLSAALNNYGSKQSQPQQQQPQQDKSPPNYAQAIRATQATPASVPNEVAQVSQQQAPKEEEKPTCDSEKLATAQDETANKGQLQTKMKQEEGELHETASSQVELRTDDSEDHRIKAAKSKTPNHDDTDCENEENNNGNCHDERAIKRPHLDLSSSSWLSPASSSGSGSNTSSDATRSTTPSSGERTTSSSSPSPPGQSISLDKQQLANISQPPDELSPDPPRKQPLHNVGKFPHTHHHDKFDIKANIKEKPFLQRSTSSSSAHSV